jgi:sugar (pentulose or hexulose) kinase
MDGSAAMLSTGAEVGQLLNVAGSTDVLALFTDRPEAHERLLTRALGVGRKWVSVATLAAGGSSLGWAHSQLFADLDDRGFWNLVRKVSKGGSIGSSRPPMVEFEPYLAGDRASIEQRHAAFNNLTLSTTREDMLGAMVKALARASADRLPLLQCGGMRIGRDVYVTGGVQRGLGKLLYRDWGRGWRFKPVEEATLKGLAKLVE